MEKYLQNKNGVKIQGTVENNPKYPCTTLSKFVLAHKPGIERECTVPQWQKCLATE